MSVCDFLTSNNVDILALTETWLGSSIDKSVIAEITPNSYDLQHISRNERKAVIFNKNLDVKPGFNGIYNRWNVFAGNNLHNICLVNTSDLI
jgi:hypothetical protein